MNVFLLGEPKTGKTYSLNTIPQEMRLVVVNGDPSGYVSLRTQYTVHNPGTAKDALESKERCIVLDYAKAQTAVSVEPTRQGRVLAQEKAYRALVADVNLTLATLSEKDVLCIDGLSGLGDVVLGAVIGINKRVKPVYEDWGQAIDKVLEIISVCAAGTPNFLLMAHIQVEKDELTGRLREGPLVYGKQLPGRLMAMFDNVFVTGVSGKLYYWVTNPQPLLQSLGSRVYDGLPERIHQNFGELFSGSVRAATTKTS